MNKGLTYLEVILGIVISGLIFWISINLMSFIFLRDVSQAYTQEFEESKARVHELISNEVAWSGDLEVVGGDGFRVDGVEYEVNGGKLTKNGNEVKLSNVTIEEMRVSDFSATNQALVQIEISLRHEKNKSIFDTLNFVVSQRETAISKNE